jgi:hypothetical protein
MCAVCPLLRAPSATGVQAARAIFAEPLPRPRS